MTFGEFDKQVRQQIAARKPTRMPDDHAIQTALAFYKEDPETVNTHMAGQCAVLALRIAAAYPGQQIAPSHGERVVIDLASKINTMIVQARKERYGTSAVPCATVEAAQTHWAGLSTGDSLMFFCRDMASATKTSPQDVGLAVLAGQRLALSAGNIGTVLYPVAMPRSEPVTLRLSTLEGLTGHVLSHTWKGWKPTFRQAVGHKPRQRIRTEEDKKKARVICTFLDVHKKARGWSPQKGDWPNGTAPKGFWPAVAQAWQEQYQQQWGEMSAEALRKADERLPQLMPHGANT